MVFNLTMIDLILNTVKYILQILVPVFSTNNAVTFPAIYDSYLIMKN